LGYATVVGVEWCVLTNGDEYRIFNAHAPVDVDKKLFRAVRVSDPSQDEYTLSTLNLLSKDNMGDKHIDSLWKAHFVDSHVKKALEELLSDETRVLINWLHRKKPELSRPEIRESLMRADIHIDFPAIMPTVEPLKREKEDARTPKKKKEKGRTHKVVGVKLADLIRAGLISPPLELEKTFRGVHFTATIQGDGDIVYDGQSYNSLSMAAALARKSIIGAPPGRKYPQTNGWIFWKYRDPVTGDLKDIDTLRQQYQEQRE
jgi:hypothetical protein